MLVLLSGPRKPAICVAGRHASAMLKIGVPSITVDSKRSAHALLRRGERAQLAVGMGDRPFVRGDDDLARPSSAARMWSSRGLAGQRVERGQLDQHIRRARRARRPTPSPVKRLRACGRPLAGQPTASSAAAADAIRRDPAARRAREAAGEAQRQVMLVAQVVCLLGEHRQQRAPDVAAAQATRSVARPALDVAVLPVASSMSRLLGAGLTRTGAGSAGRCP